MPQGILLYPLGFLFVPFIETMAELFNREEVLYESSIGFHPSAHKTALEVLQGCFCQI
jgi:hypothetical protein